MDVARKILVFLTASALGGLLLALAVLFSLNVAFGAPDTLKRWLRESNAYNTVVGSVLAQNQGGGSNSLPLDRPEVQEAANQAFSPEVLQTSAETVIDSTYRWLAGDSAQPDFRLDFGPAKQDFAEGIGDYARRRLASLPSCAANQIPDTTDPFSIECRPTGFTFDFEPEIQRLVSELANSPDFLADPVVTADSLTTLEQGREVSIFERYDNAPTVFQWLRLAPFITGTLAVLAAVAVIMLSRPRRVGLKRVALTLATSGGFLLVGALLLRFLPDGFLGGLSGTGIAASTNFASSLLGVISQTIGTVFIIFACAYLSLALALLLASRLLRRREISPTLRAPDRSTAVE